MATVEDLIVAKLEWAKLGASARQIEDVTAMLRVAAGAPERRSATATRTGGTAPRPPEPSLLLRETVSSGAVLVRLLAVFVRRVRVLFGFVVLAEIVMVGRLMMMMRGGVVVSGRKMVMLARRML